MTVAHAKSDKKLDRLASGISTMHERLHAQEARGRERDREDRGAARAHEEGSGGDADGSNRARPGSRCLASDGGELGSPPWRRGSGQPVEHFVLLEFKEPQLRCEMERGRSGVKVGACTGGGQAR